jgi:hypothetical protein
LRRLFCSSRLPEEEGAPVPFTILQESGSAFPFGVLEASLLPAAPSSGRFWSLLCGENPPGSGSSPTSWRASRTSARSSSHSRSHSRQFFIYVCEGRVAKAYFCHIFRSLSVRSTYTMFVPPSWGEV